MSVAVSVVLAVVVCALAFLLMRRRSLDAARIEQQLGEVRSRLDALVGVQKDLPLQLQSGRADQLKTLGDLKERLAHLIEATRRVESVGASVAEVQQLLRVPKLRGTLGEVWLEDLLRQVFPKSHFTMQYCVSSGEKVDSVLKLGGRLVPIDSKFPLEACQRMLEEERERKAFFRTVRLRIDEIADKYIRPDEGTYDFALMYIPAESVYYEAVVRGEEDLIAYAMSRKVIPVSPHTFYAYLSAVLHGLKALRVEESALEIRDDLAALQLQISKFQKTFELIGTHLQRAAHQYDDSDKQLEKIADRFEKITGLRDSLQELSA
jgi:DNA recombination protein RmuC